MLMEQLSFNDNDNVRLVSLETGDEWRRRALAVLENLLEATTVDRIRELVNADYDGRCLIMPFAPGTTFLQDEAGEADIVFTGEVLFEVKSNEDTEFWDREEVVEELGPMKRR